MSVWVDPENSIMYLSTFCTFIHFSSFSGLINKSFFVALSNGTFGRFYTCGI